MTKYIGFEAANSFVKIKSDIGEESYVNTRKRVSSEREAAVTVPNIASNENKVFQVLGDTDAYMIGDVEGSTSSGRDSDRYESRSYRTESLIAVAKHVENGDEVVVTTGLPATHYTNQAKDSVRRALEGAHTVTINGMPRTFTVKKVNVILQPIGTLMYLMISDDGNFRSEESRKLAELKKIVVDIGWGTTDVAELHGSHIEKSHGYNTAMQTAYDYLYEDLTHNHPELRNSEIELFKLDQLMRGNGVLDVRSIEYPLYQSAKIAFGRAAQEIMEKVKKTFPFDLYDRVIFTGGGVEALAPYLAQFINVKHAIKVHDAQMANARGYYLNAKFVK